MEESIHDLADYIVEEIEREDFQYACKQYGILKIQKIHKQLLKIWDML